MEIPILIDLYKKNILIVGGDNKAIILATLRHFTVLNIKGTSSK